MKKSQKGFGAIEILVAAVTIFLALAVGWYAWHHKESPRANTITTNTKTNNPTKDVTTVQNDQSTTSVSNGEVRLYGKITKDGCYKNATDRLPIGDVGCSITVNGYSISLKLGNVTQPSNPGTVTGLDINRDQTGQYAAIYARQINSQTASIWDDSRYYVRIE